jgi:menaquinone-dependent protoporphyrinogen oxidase
MSRILVTYASMAGSTAEVANAIGEEISRAGLAADVIPMSQVSSLEGYQGVVAGGPMIMGWHRQALGFLRRHRQGLRQRPLAIFVTAMSVTERRDAALAQQVWIDSQLPKPPADPARLTFRERYALPDNYVWPILKAARPARPISIGLFGGRLEYGRLKVWAVLFAMFVIRAPAGDRRNWPAIRQWAAEVARQLQGEARPVLAAAA